MAESSSSTSTSESPSGVLLELSGILSDQAKKLERMALLRASSASRFKWNSIPEPSALSAPSAPSESDLDVGGML